jgi:hypothetical protein
MILDRKYNLSIDFKKDQWIWFAFLWTMLTMGSTTALLFVLIVFLKFFQLKNFTSLLAFSVIIITILLSNETSSIDRFVNTTKAVVTLDADKVIAADHSASFRIVPMMVLSQKVGISSLDDVLGHGVDTVGKFLYKYLPGGGDNISGGGFFYIWYEYGFLAFFFLLLFTFKATVYKGQLINIVFWFFLVFSYGINNQIIWLCVVLLFTNNYFLSKFNTLTIK